ncbi:uncharacterized protein LOC128309305, partial [Anopheles moucheti]|uniref:uncharacterized protein LOC128309305 n=1 Tax=Anopheles moucheti TaxID=186751 RepID=UPI0022F0006E
MINEALNGRLREVTDIANKVLTNEAKRYETYATETRQLIILSNLDILQDQIETIEEAIISAKHGIPNSKLLSTEDLQTINEFLKKNSFDYNTAEELLAQSVAQFMMNTTHVLYMLKFPRISSQIYEYDFIEPIVKNGKRIICEGSNLQHPTQCVYQLIQGENSECQYEKVYSAKLITQINDANILINNAWAEITSNCSNSKQSLNGSFIIQFENCSININDEIFSNTEVIIPRRSHHSTLGLIVNETSLEDNPPTEFLNNITLENRRILQTINLQNESLEFKLHLFGSIGTTTIVIVTGIGI